KTLASASDDKTVRLWDVAAHKRLATAYEQEGALEKDLAALKGLWISVIKQGDKEVRRTLSLGKGAPLLVLGEIRSKRELLPAGNEKRNETTGLSGAEKKGDKRVMKFVGLKDGQYEVEYELTGDKLNLKGSVAGIDLTGEWTRKSKK